MPSRVLRYWHTTPTMNDELANFGSTESTTEPQGRTNIELENPRHPDYDPAYTSDEAAQAYFDAAVAAKDWPSDRKVLVGEFLQAVQALHEEGEPDRMAQFLGTLTGQECEVGGVTYDPDDE